MLRDRTVRFGMIGVVIAALCCFTPLLVVLLAALGIGWRVPSGRGYLDYVLLPMLVFFLGLTVYALWKRYRVPLSTDMEADCACLPPARKSGHSQGDEV